MTKNRSGVAALIVACGVVLLSGCGGTVSADSEASPSPSTSKIKRAEVSSMWVDTVDGRKIPCVVFQSDWDGSPAISCDWAAK